MSFHIYTGMLKMFDEFMESDFKLGITYKYPEKNDNLIKEYNLMSIVGNGDTFYKVRQILDWLSANIYNKPDYENHKEERALQLLRYSFGQGEESGVNCRALIAILEECLLSLHIKARVVYLLPMSPYDSDYHIVCEAFMPELNKWVMLDPTFNLYFTDKDKTPLNLLEIRDILKDRGELLTSEEINYNGIRDNKENIIDYYAKNLFYFSVSSIQSIYPKETIDARDYVFCPKGFDIKRHARQNVLFRIREFGSNDVLLDWLKKIEENEPIHGGLELLY